MQAYPGTNQATISCKPAWVTKQDLVSVYQSNCEVTANPVKVSQPCIGQPANRIS